MLNDQKEYHTSRHDWGIRLIGSGGLTVLARFAGALRPDFEVVAFPKPPATPKTDVAFNRHAAVAIPRNGSGSGTHHFQKLDIPGWMLQFISANPGVTIGRSLGWSFGFYVIDHRMPLLCRQAFFQITSSQSGIICNADMRVREIRQFCRLQDEGQTLMRAAMSQLNLSARAYHRILKLVRTIADLAGSEEIQAA